MTEQEKLKLNEKLAKFAELKDFQVKNGIIEYSGYIGDGWFPNLYVDYFTDSLDACFQMLVPKLLRDGEYPYLKSIEIEPAMCDELCFTCYLYYESLHDDGFIEREESAGYANTPALALCLAIEKLIDTQKDT